MKLKFTKMHGLGNDFMVIDGVNQSVKLTAQDVKKLSDRHLGVGFDQCLLVEPSNTQGVDFNYTIYNADGSQVGQCGNGARCLASFIQRKKLSTKKQLTVATSTTQMQLKIETDNSVTVVMDVPKLEPESIPLNYSSKQPTYAVPLQFDDLCMVNAINVGNPHAILTVDSPSDAYVNRYGEAISQHPLFPEQTNVGFMTIISNSHIVLRVYERGVGETQACGSGAVAAAAVGILYHGLQKKLEVSLPGGSLNITWPHLDDNILLNGPTAFVFDGEICVL